MNTDEMSAVTLWPAKYLKFAPVVSAMSLPSFQNFFEPVLRILASEPRDFQRQEVMNSIPQQMKLTPEQIAERIPKSGHPRHRDRAGWALTYLKILGLAHSPQRGVYRLMLAGTKLLEDHPKGFNSQIVEKLLQSSRNYDRRTSKTSPEKSEADEAPINEGTPTDEINQALKTMDAALALELKEKILQASPEFFERLVLDVLQSMGYGKDEDSAKLLGRSGDEGIDGVISLDRLGLEKVYVQAKRWQGSVSSPQIQGFMGALTLQGANKGVLISAGDITKPARELAQKATGKVVLIDGDELTRLMIEYGVGTSHQVLKIPKIDLDYFEDE